MNGVVLDLETTGLDYKLDRILEIGAVRVENGRPVAEFHCLLDPGVELREGNIAIHGISADMVVGCPSVTAVLPSLLDFLGDSPIIAHNAVFDYNFLNFNAIECLGRALSNPIVDTLEIAREVFPEEKAPSLERLLQLFGEPARPLHRALEDARALACILERLLDLQAQRRAWHRAQFDRIDHVAARYLQVSALIADLQGEAAEMRRTLELAFLETDREAIAVPGVGTLRLQRRECWEFHPEEARAVLAELGILDRVLRIDRSKLDRWLKGDRLTEQDKARLLATRRFLGERRVLSVETLTERDLQAPSMR